MAHRQKKEPIHQIFYLCSTYTPDNAWADFLRDCSFGKFPRGVRFEDNAIKCSRGKLVFVEYIPKDPEKAFEAILTVFRDRLGIKTAREKKSAVLKFNRLQEAARIQSWKDAKTSASRMSLIRNYVDRVVTHYSMNDDERAALIALLEICVANKILDKDRIEIADGRIVKIEGLEFDPYTRKSTLRGQIKHPVPVVIPMPIDFKPVEQHNNPKNYLALVDYHTAKIKMAEG